MELTHTLQDVGWILICTALVLLMQGGFCCLESGLVRAKNSVNVAIKNFVDFCMPVMNGLAAANEIFKEYGRDRMKIIAFTAAGLEHEREATMKHGFHDFVIKPTQKEEIYACLKKHLDIEYLYEVEVEPAETKDENKVLESG